MGRSSLEGMMEHTDAKTAFDWHMAHNLFPPPSAELAARCWDAIEKFNAGDLGLDDTYDFSPAGKLQPFGNAVRAFRLDAFLEPLDA